MGEKGTGEASDRWIKVRRGGVDRWIVILTKAGGRMEKKGPQIRKEDDD